MNQKPAATASERESMNSRFVGIWESGRVEWAEMRLNIDGTGLYVDNRINGRTYDPLTWKLTAAQDEIAFTADTGKFMAGFIDLCEFKFEFSTRCNARGITEELLTLRTWFQGETLEADGQKIEFPAQWAERTFVRKR